MKENCQCNCYSEFHFTSTDWFTVVKNSTFKLPTTLKSTFTTTPLYGKLTVAMQ